MTNPLLDIRIGTMVKANRARPRRAMFARSFDYGFESIEPFFWQTIGDKDIPRLAARAQGRHRRRRRHHLALGMFGNPLEDQDARPRDARTAGRR